MVELLKAIIGRREILKESFEEDNIKYEDSTFVNSVTLFMHRKIEPNHEWKRL